MLSTIPPDSLIFSLPTKGMCRCTQDGQLAFPLRILYNQDRIRPGSLRAAVKGMS